MALFDYDPISMSPNPDAAEEELPFKEGQILKVRTVLHEVFSSMLLLTCHVLSTDGWDIWMQNSVEQAVITFLKLLCLQSVPAFITWLMRPNVN